MYVTQPLHHFFDYQQVSLFLGNVALSGTMGGPEKYDMYLRYGAPPTLAKYDYRSQVGSTPYSR